MKNKIDGFTWQRIINKSGVAVEMLACPTIGRDRSLKDEEQSDDQSLMERLNDLVLRVTISCLFSGEPRLAKSRELLSISLPRRSLITEFAAKELIDASYEISGAGYGLGVRLYGCYPKFENEFFLYIQMLRKIYKSGIFISVADFIPENPLPVEISAGVCKAAWLDKNHIFGSSHFSGENFGDLSRSLVTLRDQNSIFLGINGISDVNELSVMSKLPIDLFMGPYVGEPVKDIVCEKLFGS